MRRSVARLYEERARAGVTWRPMSCWDQVEIHPDERAPHGVFFRRRRPMSGPTSPLSLAPRRTPSGPR